MRTFLDMLTVRTFLDCSHVHTFLDMLTFLDMHTCTHS